MTVTVRVINYDDSNSKVKINVKAKMKEYKIWH